MFYYIEGKLAHTANNLVVIDCGGVGYAVHTSQNTIMSAKVGETLKVFTYVHVREDIFDIFGFKEQEELAFFKQLISVSGVGPRAALAILSVAPVSTLALSVMTGDEKLLTQASGIGKKIASRVVLELQDKIGKETVASSKGTMAASFNAVSTNSSSEAISALMVLGYSQSEATMAMKGLDLESLSTDEIIKACLKKLAMG